MFGYIGASGTEECDLLDEAVPARADRWVFEPSITCVWRGERNWSVFAG